MKKKLIIVAAVIATILLAVFTPKLVKNFTQKKTDTSEESRTVILTKEELKQSVVVKGIVKSEVSSSVSSPIEAKIVKLNVKAGDLVQKGDVIAELDNSSVLTDLEKKKKDIAKQKADYKDAFDKLTKQQEAAAASKKRIAEDQGKLVASAQTEYQNAVSSKNNYNTTYQNALNEYNQVQNEIKARTDDVTSKEALLQQAYEAWVAAGMPTTTPYDKDNATDAEKAYHKANEELTNAKTALTTAETIYDFAGKEKAYNDAQATLNTLTSAVQSASDKKSEAERARDEAIRNADSTINDLNVQAAAALKTYQEYTGKEELADLEKQKENMTLKAETAGKITELNVKMGSVAKGEVAVIQSVDNLKLEVQVDASDITKIKEGMKVLITTDTSNETVGGSVKRVSPTASSAEGKEGFTVEIGIDDASKVYIGTKASAEIIISSTPNVLTVPLDAVHEDADGSHVMVKQKDGTFKDTVVTTGASNEFNIEIKGSSIQEGTEIQAVYDWQALKESQKDPMEG